MGCQYRSRFRNADKDLSNAQNYLRELCVAVVGESVSIRTSKGAISGAACRLQSAGLAPVKKKRLRHSNTGRGEIGE